VRPDPGVHHRHPDTLAPEPERPGARGVHTGDTPRHDLGGRAELQRCLEPRLLRLDLSIRNLLGRIREGVLPGRLDGQRRADRPVYQGRLSLDSVADALDRCLDSLRPAADGRHRQQSDLRHVQRHAGRWPDPFEVSRGDVAGGLGGHVHASGRHGPSHLIMACQRPQDLLHEACVCVLRGEVKAFQLLRRHASGRIVLLTPLAVGATTLQANRVIALECCDGQQNVDPIASLFAVSCHWGSPSLPACHGYVGW
jgi:hypothetical protein